MPTPFVKGDKRIARLFADYKHVELDYLQPTGIFPIMHVTTIKQEIIDKYPWVRDQPGEGVRGAKQLAYDASPIRAWCRSRSCAPRWRSRRRCSAATPGRTG